MIYSTENWNGPGYLAQLENDVKGEPDVECLTTIHQKHFYTVTCNFVQFNMVDRVWYAQGHTETAVKHKYELSILNGLR